MNKLMCGSQFEYDKAVKKLIEAATEALTCPRFNKKFRSNLFYAIVAVQVAEERVRRERYYSVTKDLSL